MFYLLCRLQINISVLSSDIKRFVATVIVAPFRKKGVVDSPEPIHNIRHFYFLIYKFSIDRESIIY